MKKLITMMFLVGVVLGLSYAISGCKKSDESGSQSQGTAAKVKEEMKGAAEATGEYLAEQKDTFMNQAQESYANLESQTSQLIDDLQDEGSQKWQQTRTELKGKLDAVKAEMDELADKSGKAWQESKDELSDALDDLKKAYEQAKAEFQKDGEKV